MWNALPETGSDLSHDPGIDQARDDAPGGVAGNVKEVLQRFECHSRFRFVNHMIHDGSHNLRAAPFLTALDAHSILRPLVSARLVPTLPIRSPNRRRAPDKLRRDDAFDACFGSAEVGR